MDARQKLAMILAGLAAAALLGLGYWYGSVSCGQKLEQARAQADLFNREAAKQKAIAVRLQNELAELRGTGPAVQPEDEDAAEATGGIPGRVLRKGEAAILLGGDLIVTLEEVRSEPPAAALRLQNAAGRRGSVVLRPGGETLIEAGGRAYRLILRRVGSNSASIAILAR